MIRVVAIIPARYASQRLPAKPLADICGKPMVQHVYERAGQSRRVDDVVVATDDARIEAAVRSFGGKVVMTPSSLQSGTDRIAFVAKELPDADIVVNVQGDEPLIEPAMIDEAVTVVAEGDALVGTLVKKIERQAELFNPSVVKVALGAKGQCLYFSRSPIPFGRDVEHDEWLRYHTFYKHIGVYVFRRDFLLRVPTMAPTPLEQAEKLEQLRILEHGFAITAAVTTFDSIPVDTAEDLERVRMTCANEHERV
jgi:3-deoxy-manno-octulosonate cytidylyltransferase (CMP-KDO synthetase)